MPTDTERLDWLARHPSKVKILKAGILAVGIEVWQPNLRAAIDAAMKLEKHEAEFRQSATRAEPRQ